MIVKGKRKPKDMVNSEQLTKLGNRIRNLRLKAGYQSQEIFAYESNIPRAQYARYEKGTNITYVSLLKIISVHKLSVHEFFSEGFD
ncbi:MAG: helix-turn-helix transcriptional regulator [Cytophagales bacterium]|nr:helix-turn-helix transcriptional regulator [Cytophagales bacterium]